MKKNKHDMKSLLDREKKSGQKKPKKNLKLTHNLSKKSSLSKSKSPIGPFLTATFTAILIGLFLGVMMLIMFTKKEDHASTNDDQFTPTQGDINDNDNDVDQTDIKPTTLKQMNAFVLQLGVFSETENADAWSETYQQVGFPSVHFQRDNQYFLFAGMAETKEKAKEFATILLEDDIEVYVKEWTTNEIELELTEDESEWLKLFQEQWEKTLQSLTKQEGLSHEGWRSLTENHPQQSEEITQLVQAIQSLPGNETEMENDFESQNHLLNIWKIYEEVFY